MFAFALCYQLADFQLPDSLEYIGSYAFVECSSLRDVAIPNGLAYYGKNVFEGCISQDPAFADCRTEGSYQYQILADSFAVLIHYDGQEEEVLLPETLAGYPLIEIRSYAFEGKENLKHISLPDSLLRIGEGAFIGCRQLTKVDFSPRLTAIEGYAFAYCTSLSDVILPPSMIDCGENVFEGCISTPDHIEYEGIGTSLPLIEKERGDYVYYLLADSLAVLTKYTGASEALVLPDTLDGYPLYRIDAYAFDENETLKSITLPKSLREVKANSFSGCRRLKKLIFTAPMNADVLESIKSFDLDIVYIPENK